MKRNQGLWVLLMAGALLAGGVAAAGRADAVELTSGALRASDSEESTHCSVVNVNPQPITVTIAIKFGNDGSVCNSVTQVTLPTGQNRGVTCEEPGRGTFCTVSGTFNASKIRAVFSRRDSSNVDVAVTDVR